MPAHQLRCFSWLPVLISAACVERTQAPPPNFDRQAVEKEIRAMFADHREACRREGLLAEFPFLDSSDLFYWVPPGFSGPIDLDSVHAILRKNAPTLRSIDNEWRQLRVDALSDSLASYIGRLHSTTVSVQGDTQRVDLLETGLVVKRSSGWKLRSGQTNLASQ